MAISISLSDIQVRRGGRTILSVEQLTIPAGGFTVLAGHNGAGKTTLLKVCCGLIRPTRGIVRLNGQEIFRGWKGRFGPYRNPIGYVPQQTETNAHLPFTVQEVVSMGLPGRLFGRQTAQDRQTVLQRLDEMGLAEQSGQTFRSLSGGQQQKVLIARAMAANPRLLLLDEPGTYLDPFWKKQLGEILQRLHSTYSLTIVMISHDWDWIPECCRQVVLLECGRVRFAGSRQDFSDRTTELYRIGPADR
ncbi:MAG: ATP-binding cassette domain-containing protein [Anaerohalosphaeraceae bacterium]